ncbi:hypothetical protein [Calycomorphotria hydatis]|uniref:Uncharacterized protein n=1 Tax=Calycomorphotria hydatis TaxID=2528027 RepID=A0A517T6S9_9PLAN|nr:hypothetical protein [Calycomorphotria hydatis]QDT64085.1 hypothetical protein V22_13160 [Calycomorphotria hydatis]
MLRSDAQRIYGRAKSSFIRDVEAAFTRHDDDFLSHFRVGLNDGSIIEGPEATKEAIRVLQSKQPRWYIETTFLESRYWDTSDSSHTESASQSRGKHRGPGQSKLEGVSETTQLRHELVLAEQKIEAQQDTIARQENEKQFLRDELSNRRGEVDRLRELFESVGGAAQSAARLKGGNSAEQETPPVEVQPISSQASSHTQPQSPFAQHLPTLHKVLGHFRSR